MDTSLIQPPARRTRRRHSAEFRASVIAACQQPGISMAAVALANGLNANMLRKWVAESSGTEVQPPQSAESGWKPLAGSAPGFVPLTLPSPVTAAQNGDIRVEVRRGGMTVSVTWPASAADACTAWLRDLLR